MANPVKLSRSLQANNGDAIPVVWGSGSRVNATATAASTAEAALPTGATLIELRATDAVAIRFGNTGMGAAAVDANSILFPAGEKVLPVPLDSSGIPFDYFRVIRVGAEDVPVQIELVHIQA